VSVEHKLAQSAVKGVDEKARIVQHAITVRCVDRDGDVVIPTGGSFGDYLKNPAVFFNHRASDAPIGRCLELKASDNEVVAVTQFAGLDQLHPQAETIFRLVRDGFLKGWSIGFTVVQATREKVFAEQTGRTIAQWRLLEYSSVGIPSNPEALTRMCKGYGLPDGASEQDLYDALAQPQRKWWEIARPIIPNTTTEEIEMSHELSPEEGELLRKADEIRARTAPTHSRQLLNNGLPVCSPIRPLSPARVNRHQSVLRGVLRFARRLGYLRDRDLPHLRDGARARRPAAVPRRGRRHSAAERLSRVPQSVALLDRRRRPELRHAEGRDPRAHLGTGGLRARGSHTGR
jgi:HK97 family phage prohead protease